MQGRQPGSGVAPSRRSDGCRSFAEFYERWQSLRAAESGGLQGIAAEDVVQQVFLTLCKDARSREIGHPASYVWRAGRNEALKHRRRLGMSTKSHASPRIRTVESRGRYAMSRRCRLPRVDRTLAANLFVCLILSPFGRPVEAQPAKLIRDCTERCPVEVTRSITLGDSSGPGFVGQPAALLRLRDGRFVLADRYDQDRVKVFASDGTFLQSVGRRGQGPGEFQVAQFLILLEGDSIEVFDFHNARASIFGPDLQFVGAQQVALSGPEMVRLADGSRVFSLRSSGPNRIGLPLHLVSPEGDYLRSFGADGVIEEVTNASLFYRQLAVSDVNAVWAAHLTRYRIEEWTTTGRLLTVLERRVDWFPPQEHYSSLPRTGQPPTPGLLAIQRDSLGLLWVLVVVPDAEWERGWVPGRDVWGRESRVPADFNVLYDTVVEAIDPTSLRLVGTVKLDHRVAGFADDRLVYSHGEHDNGEPFIQLWRLDLPHH